MSDKTVGAQRKEMEGRAEIPHIPLTTDTLGRVQPRERQQRKQLESEAVRDEFIDACLTAIDENDGYANLVEVARFILSQV